MEKLKMINLEVPVVESPWPAKRAKRSVKKEEEEEDDNSDAGPAPKRRKTEHIRDSSDDDDDAGAEPDDTDTSNETPEEKGLTPEDLEAIYPHDLIKELLAPKPVAGSGYPKRPRRPTAESSTDNTAGGPAVVYVVTHSKAGYSVTEEFDIVGTYSTMEAANFKVMSIFHKAYPEFTEVWKDKPSRDDDDDDGGDGGDGGGGNTSDSSRRSRDPAERVKKSTGQPDGDKLTYWWVNDDGALSLWTSGEMDDCYRICATRQEVRTDGFAGGRVVSVCSTF
ncbi:hypothetical protein M434DRAFT_36320 [Hypoxylon sp. CO27-5]|nr:hypothetical protein M434DRAFT_36320 [Hypoxylon sp. CO27-5]